MTSEEYDRLTDEEKRIKVAELCGYNHLGYPTLTHNPPRMELQEDGYTYDIPDYLNDLNACHEFEKLIPYEKRYAYEQLLKGEFEWDWTYHATAEEKCKAFVLTMTGGE